MIRYNPVHMTVLESYQDKFQQLEYNITQLKIKIRNKVGGLLMTNNRRCKSFKCIGDEYTFVECKRCGCLCKNIMTN